MVIEKHSQSLLEQYELFTIFKKKNFNCVFSLHSIIRYIFFICLYLQPKAYYQQRKSHATRFQRSQILWLFATHNARHLSFSNRNNKKRDICKSKRILTKRSNTIIIHCTFNITLFRIDSCILCIRVHSGITKKL